MGCGAVCGKNSSIYEPNQFSQKIVMSMIPKLKHSKQFIQIRQYQSFINQINQYPLKYRLKVSSKLVPKEQIDPGILIKWKVLLYCFQTSNPHFNSCLGRKFKKIEQKNTISQNDGIRNDQEKVDVLQQNSIIYPNIYFQQVQKDIDRTGYLPDQKKKVFQRILKRITNHFPIMGYTQGINFIIWYLLTIGFQEFDAFWIFIHISINRRFLVLGMFQNNFPLQTIYNTIFKNILQRINPLLYSHLYEQLKIRESEWLSKWFWTYFIYSFPQEMIKYVFDIAMEVGGLGLIKFAISIIQELDQILMEQNQGGNILCFFGSLKDINVFNQYISINKVIERAYSLEIKKEDFRGIDGINEFDTQPTSFYSQYVLSNVQNQFPLKTQQSTIMKVQDQNQQNNNKKKQQVNTKNSPNQILHSWYQKLSSERQNFIQSNTKINGRLKDKKKNERISIENQLHFLVHNDKQQEIVKSPGKESSTKSNKNSVKDSIQMKKESIPSTGCSFNKKGSQIYNRDNVSQIDELWQEQDRNSNISRNMSSKMSQQSRTQNGFNQKIRKHSYVDQLDKFASTHCNPLGKSKATGYNDKISTIFTQQKLNSLKPKINNFQVSSSRASHLARAGQNILSNLSINEHSQHQSINSEYSKYSQKQKKTKENDIYGKNYYKTKSKKQISLHRNQNQNQPQNDKHDKKSLHDHNSSSVESYVDQHNSFYASNEFIQDEMKNNQFQSGSVKAFESHRQRVSTQQDFLTNSLHASHVKENNSKYIGSNASEIEIYQAPQIFKKKNRVSSRINGAQGDILLDAIKPAKLSNIISEVNIIQKGDNSMKTIKICIQQGSMNYEESYESIFVPSEGQKSNTFRFHQQLQKCQVESVK